jgi:hypothetical protein
MDGWMDGCILFIILFYYHNSKKERASRNDLPCLSHCATLWKPACQQAGNFGGNQRPKNRKVQDPNPPAGGQNPIDYRETPTPTPRASRRHRSSRESACRRTGTRRARIRRSRSGNQLPIRCALRARWRE